MYPPAHTRPCLVAMATGPDNGWASLFLFVGLDAKPAVLTPHQQAETLIWNMPGIAVALNSKGGFCAPVVF